MRSNQLSGPAFPPAWLAPGAFGSLSFLALGWNGLTGSLPPALAWPRLETL